VGHGKRSTKLFEDTALECGVLGVLVDRAGFIEVIHAASMILRIESRFDLDLALHVAWCHARGVAHAKRHARGARVFDALTTFDCVREHVLDTIDPSD
jgi:hypothetical protein